MKNTAVMEAVLSKAFSKKIRLDDGRTPEGGSNRSKVFRFKTVSSASGVPETVIVKCVNPSETEPYVPDKPGGPAGQLFDEWASLQLLTEVSGDEPIAPRFYGGDRSEGFILMEDIGQGDSLVQPLLGDNPVAAEEALIMYFEAIGKLHALTIGKEGVFRRIRDHLGPQAHEPSITEVQEDTIKHLDDVCGNFNVRPKRGFKSEIKRAAKSFFSHGPFFALTQGDACPDNCLFLGATIRLFDFEFGKFRHALDDGARARSNFPTCWCVNRLPDPIIRRIETVYRMELAKGCPEARDRTLFNRALVEACAKWAIQTFGRFMPGILEEDNQWGISTRRQRVIVRFDLLARATEEFGHMEAVGATVAELAKKFQAQWQLENDPMPYYPAFAQNR